MDSCAMVCHQENNVNKVMRHCAMNLRDVFQVITNTLLSLLLPLAYLLLARLTTARYLLAVSAYPTTEPHSPIQSFFLYNDGSLHYVLVAVVTGATLVHVLLCPVYLSVRSPIRSGGLRQLNREINGPVSRPRLYAAWVFLCVFQVCVCLGIEGSIAAGVDASGFGEEKSLLSRVIFFLGLHETMLHWSKTVVKPIVDDTLFGYARKQRWIEKVGMALSFGGLWWWRMRDEIESLVVVVVKVKRELSTGVGVFDFAGWWLYYLTVIIGVVRVVTGLLWAGMILLCRRRVQANHNGDFEDNDDKV